MTNRPQSYRFHQGDRTLPFAPAEYDARLSDLRELMQVHGVEACVFTSVHNIAYYSGFLYCSFGRPYGLVVTDRESVTISAGIDAGQPWRGGMRWNWRLPSAFPMPNTVIPGSGCNPASTRMVRIIP